MHPLEKKVNPKPLSSTSSGTRKTTRIDFRRTHRTLSRPCFIVVVVVGAWRPAPFGEPRSPPVANRGGRARRAHRATSRAKLQSRARLVAARAAVRSRRVRSLLVHLLVLLPLDEVDDAGDGGGDLRIARRGTTRGEARNARGNSRGTKRPRRDGRYSRTRGFREKPTGPSRGTHRHASQAPQRLSLVGLAVPLLVVVCFGHGGRLEGRGVLGRGRGCPWWSTGRHARDFCGGWDESSTSSLDKASRCDWDKTPRRV